MEVLFENTRLLVVNKPAGTTVERPPHRGYTSVEDLAWEHMKNQKIKKPYLGVVHRLDRPVSGVLVFAKKRSSLKFLNAAFRDRKVEKVYWAVVEGRPEPAEGSLEHWLIKDQESRRAKVASKKAAGSKYSLLHYRVLAQKENLTWLEVHPVSGKYHQIRAQLSAVGCPIWGDELYGGSVAATDHCIALHARQLTVPDPEDPEKKLHFVADIPPSFPNHGDLRSP